MAFGGRWRQPSGYHPHARRDLRALARAATFMPSLLYLLAAINLVIGTGAFMLSGFLPAMAQDLGVSVPAAGQATTAYALATAFIAPALLVWTGQWSRRKAVLAALALFFAGNVIVALAPSLTVVLLGRVVMGMGALFTAIASGLAVASVEPAKRGKALSLTFVGISMSYVIGVPLGAYLASKYGWRMPVYVVCAATLVVLGLAWTLIPRNIQTPPTSFGGVAVLLKQWRVSGTLALTLLYIGAIFCVFAYGGPVFQALVPMSAERLSLTFMIFGISGVAGTLIGGWASDRFGPVTTLKVQLSVVLLMMLVIPFTKGQYGLMLLCFFVWGTAGFGMMPPQQTRLAAVGGAQTPLLLSLNASMLYLGTALGAVLGGAMVDRVGYAQLSWVAAPLITLGLLGLLVSPIGSPLRPASHS
jgi:MFS transporter, DHA1 family, inner membrane transport protein